MDDDSASPESMVALKQLMAKPENRMSSNLGVFICCSGVHPSLGTHISKVLSLTLDEWTNSQVETMLEIGGNSSANAIYEAYIPKDVMKPSSDASVDDRSDYIRRKYEDQEFVKPSLRISLSTSSASKRSNHSMKGSLSSKSNSGLSQTEVGMVEFQGLLKLRVIKGTYLAIRDVKTSDPYVVVSIGHQPRLVPVPDPPTAPQESDPRWELLSSLTLWFIWRARCCRSIEGQLEPPAETVRAIWQEILHTLRGCFERIQGDSDSATQRRLAFHSTWSRGPFYSHSSGPLCWHYRPPIWLFPPPIL
ncbi:hypothetical protein L7F22_022255 [Adiantum nelumboides]|nr:hypothetical protein [Adiantum nelumboides]